MVVRNTECKVIFKGAKNICWSGNELDCVALIPSRFQASNAGLHGLAQNGQGFEGYEAIMCC